MVLSPESLVELAHTTMPFGRYTGYRLLALPEEYLISLEYKGFPEDRIGELLKLALFIKSEGLEYLLDPITKPLAPTPMMIQ